jgi:CubicO group peptidase (beta-lactamase class C family)
VTPTLVVLAARRGVIVLHEAFGVLRPGPGAPPTAPDSLFPLASLAKVITATAILILVEDGLVGLNRPVQDYLPEYVGEGKDAVMVHHLLTHTSGWRGDDVAAHVARKQGTVAIPPLEPTQHPQLHEQLVLRYDAPLSQPPGKVFMYSSATYLLLGEIVRRVSGQHLGDFVRERIFGPLGMLDSFFSVPEAVQHRIAHHPPESEMAQTVEDPGYLDRPHGGVGGHSTAGDMAIFCQMFLNHGSYGEARVLSPASVREMTRNQIPGVGGQFKEEDLPEACWGYGWRVKGNKKTRYEGALDSPASYSHQGAGGVSITVDPTYDLVTVYFSVAGGIMSPDHYRPVWAMDLFTDLVTAAVVEV